MNIATAEPEKRERLMSLDTLRGFDMFWITGGEFLFKFIGGALGFQWLVEQMEHAKWAGLHMYDIVFPLFVFISGVAIPYAIVSKLEKNISKSSLLYKAFLRMVILVFLGIVYNEALKGDFSKARYASVLGQIGIAYFIAAAIVIYSKSIKTWFCWLGGVLLGYALVQFFVPVPYIGAGILTPKGSINGYIDRMILPGRLYSGSYDPEGILCVVSAVTLVLMGAVAGYVLRGTNRNPWHKIYLLSGIGFGALVLGLALHPYYPMIKRIWTSTFNLSAGGICFLLIALFYMIVDVLKCQKWTLYFRVIGMNSIFIYLFVQLAAMGRIAKMFFGWAPIVWGDFGQFIFLVGRLAIIWAILYFMYKKQVFIRV